MNSDKDLKSHKKILFWNLKNNKSPNIDKANFWKAFELCKGILFKFH